jgi:hypothetical protein
MGAERSASNWWHSAGAPLCVLPALYVGGYFVLIERPVANVRIYRSRAVADVYAPLS